VRKLVLILGVAAVPLCIFAADTSAEVHSGGNAIAVEVNGTKLAMSDLEKEHPAALFQAKNTYYEAEKKAIDAFVDEYLLNQQAKKEGLTLEQLLEKHVNNAIAKDPAEETLRVYYEGVDTTESYQAVRGKIIEAIRSRRMTKARAAYLQSLRSQANVAVRLGPPRAEISLKNTPVRGQASAPVTFVEFADYECPYCQQIQPVLDRLQADFKGKLAFVYKDSPLPMHANAEKAAEASHCAEAQGKYWEYHDALYAKKELEVPALKLAARELKLDGNAFDKCLDSGEKSEGIKLSLNDAQALGIQGTPTFFINGRYFSGALSYEQLRAVVEEELGGSQAQQIAAR
jgi:protein-disulfide isomerase